MRSTDRHPVADDLAQHAGFLRAVARGLVADEHLAEDVVQQAYLQALARPPESRGFLRAWLARVVRNLALNRARGEARRSARERAAARPELDSAGERAALELALQREVAAALAELDEPYRTVVHLRYFRGLAPSAIAAELGVPLKTVETRLTRAHARLRMRLARAWDEQDERARALWLASLPGPAKILGGVLMTKQLVVVGLGGALLVGLVLTWRVQQAPATRGEAPAVVEGELEPPQPASSPESAPTETREAAAALESNSGNSAEPDPLAVRDAELAAALERLGPVLDRSLTGLMDPGAILDAALLIAARDVGAPYPELELNGTLAFPFEGLPDGVEAKLSVGSPLKEPFVGLTIQLPRSQPFAFEGVGREGPEVWLVSHLQDDGELRSMSILTSVDAREEELSRGGSFRYSFSATLQTTLSGGTSWNLRMTENEVTALADGGQHQRFVERTVPQVLDGNAWPRTDAMHELTQRLRDLHELAKARAAR